MLTKEESAILKDLNEEFFAHKQIQQMNRQELLDRKQAVCEWSFGIVDGGMENWFSDDLEKCDREIAEIDELLNVNQKEQ